MTVPSPPPLPPAHRDGSRTWQSRTVQQQVAWLRAAAIEMDRLAGEVVPRACRDQYAGSSGGSSRVADDGSVPGPTPIAAERGELRDPVREAGALFFGGLVQARLALEQMVNAASALVALSPEEAQELLDMMGRGGRMAGHCVNCNRWVAGTASDRLRAWRCEACWKYRARHAGEERPRHLWDNGDEEEPPMDLVHVYRCPVHGRRRFSVDPEPVGRPCGFAVAAPGGGVAVCEREVVHEVSVIDETGDKPATS